ncbi:MAG TPA: AAA family ATPase [Pyrinomonadaceae bacterium]|jgi:SpoVK/Ycf46/Vps4 family AAA+-type ATPase|nr:AAA family ATPase [Pyrinomonadaceae bacterium]
MAKPLEATFKEHRGGDGADSAHDELLAVLRRLDRMLERALACFQTSSEGEPHADPFRGLYTSPHELTRLLAQDPCAPSFATGDAGGVESLFDAEGSYPARLAALAATFQLSVFDLHLVVVALAPELDLRYEKIYASLQDDVTRKRPSVDLALNLLCTDAAEKFARRAHFASDAPLIRHGLVTLLPDPNQFQPPLLAHYLKLDEQVVHFLLEERSLDARLARFCRMIEPAQGLDELPVSDEMKRALPVIVTRAHETNDALTLYFRGLRGTGRRRTAEALAGVAGARLLHVDVSAALASGMEFEQALRLVFREAQLQSAFVYLDSMDALAGIELAPVASRLSGALAESACVTILAGEKSLAASGSPKALDVHFPVQNFAQRRAIWQARLAERGHALDAPNLDALASRFRLTHEEIGASVAAASERARWRDASTADAAGDVSVHINADARVNPNSHARALSNSQASLEELFAAARAQSSRHLSTLARHVEPVYGWDEIVLPPDQLAQLTEICNQAKHRHIVYGKWGFDRKLSLGKGLNALFSGPPGTGKTMSAEVIARELRLALYKIDLSQIVSKYIGETEKNLDRIFREAQSSYSILFFDEADALFGKRSEVKDAHDRYANIEVGYLLQKMEEFEGIAILATNLRQHLDEAFVRRMHFIVEFPFPDEEYRRRIWEVMFPQEAPLDPEVDFQLLAREIKLAGGQIKNIALSAAFNAASDGGVINLAHLRRAAHREHQKLGRSWNEAGLTAPPVAAVQESGQEMAVEER